MSTTTIKPFAVSNDMFSFLRNALGLFDMKPSVDANNTVGEIAPTYYNSTDENGITIMVDLPGVPKEAISCTIDKGNFALTAPRDFFGEKCNYSLNLRFSPEFDSDKAKIVSYKDGLLTINVPRKAKPANEPRKLTIE